MRTKHVKQCFFIPRPLNHEAMRFSWFHHEARQYNNVWPCGHQTGRQRAPRIIAHFTQQAFIAIRSMRTETTIIIRFFDLIDILLGFTTYLKREIGI